MNDEVGLRGKLNYPLSFDEEFEILSEIISVLSDANVTIGEA
jgi:hypothetical protein